jgi:hypothetical protein
MSGSNMSHTDSGVGAAQALVRDIPRENFEAFAQAGVTVEEACVSFAAAFGGKHKAAAKYKAVPSHLELEDGTRLEIVEADE